MTILERWLHATRAILEQDIAQCSNQQSRTFCSWYTPDKAAKLQAELSQIIDVQMYLERKTESPQSAGEETE